MRYNPPTSPVDQLRDFFVRGQIPVTMTVLAVNVLTFLACFFSPETAPAFFQQYVIFSPDAFFHAPWTIFTFPLVSLTPFSISLILTWVFFWLSGGSLERGWGSQRYAIFFASISAISALSLFAGAMLLRGPVLSLNDLFLPVTGLIVAFCMLNPEQQIVVYFFPVQAKYVAIGVTIWTYLNYGSIYGPILGLFALGGILAAYLYVRFARPWADIGNYGSRPTRSRQGPDLRIDPSTSKFRTRTNAIDGSPERSPFDLIGKWKDYQERKRLEKLWKNSGFSDADERWKDDDSRRR